MIIDHRCKYLMGEVGIRKEMTTIAEGKIFTKKYESQKTRTGGLLCTESEPLVVSTAALTPPNRALIHIYLSNGIVKWLCR